MSMPTKAKLGVYSFYIEVSGNRDQQEEIFATLKELASNYQVHLLGYYAVWACGSACLALIARCLAKFCRWNLPDELPESWTNAFWLRSDIAGQD